MTLGHGMNITNNFLQILNIKVRLHARFQSPMLESGAATKYHLHCVFCNAALELYIKFFKSPWNCITKLFTALIKLVA
jgi:hypothetical protein